MTTLVECVPNFSEGRNRSVVDTLVQAVQSVAGVQVLDRRMDADHHRSVLTFVGPPEAVGAAAFEVVKTARELIDLSHHRGVHPRLGSTDVLPFVPVNNTAMDECVELARTVGARIGNELNIPVYLYEQAATSPVHRALEQLRRGDLAGLKDRMQSDPDWVPDYGRPYPHPTAGVTAVGARPILVAFNVNLASANIAVAKTVAKAIRWSSGGLKHVKAMGVELKSRGLVQVSTNLTNVSETPIRSVFEAIKKTAERYGAIVAGSEIVGLVPEQALTSDEGVGLQLERFSEDQILERRLARYRENCGGPKAP